MRVRFGGVELLRHHFAVDHRKVEHPVRKLPVLIFVNERLGLGPRLRHAGNKTHRDGCTRLEGEPAANGDNGVEHRTLGSAKRPVALHCFGVPGSTPASGKGQTVGLVRNLIAIEPADGKKVEHPRTAFPGRTGPAGTQDCIASRDDFGLYEEI